MRRRLIAYTHGQDDPAGRFRIAQYADSLRGAGWDLSLRPRIRPGPGKAPAATLKRSGSISATVCGGEGFADYGTSTPPPATKWPS